MFFPSIHVKVRLSRHAATRMKERAGLNTKSRIDKFMKSASKSSLSLSMIPQSKFPEFFSYMKRIADNSRRRTGDDCTVLLFRDYFLIISRFHGDIVTLINVDPEYKGIYDKITRYKSTPKSGNQIDNITNDAERILKNTSNLDRARSLVISILTSHGLKLETAVDTVKQIIENLGYQQKPITE
jgi:hypothetical protein